MSSLLCLSLLSLGLLVATIGAETQPQPISSLRVGAVVAWGLNNYGQASVPAGLGAVVAVASGEAHTVVLKSDGTVVGWGQNNVGQATAPAGLSGVTAIAAYYQQTMALKSDGTVVAWGYNHYYLTRVPADLAGVTAIAAGAFHRVALKSDGTVVAWGPDPTFYTSGAGPNYNQAVVPSGLTGVTAIAAGFYHTVALKSDGTVVAWGDNSVGATNVPIGLGGVVAIAAGASHNVALKNDGTVVAWGLNDQGQTTVPAGLTGVSAISAGKGHTMALKSDGTVVVWGWNAQGQRNVPAGLNGAMAIAAGDYHSVVLVPPIAPTITTQPLNHTVSVGQSVTFAVAATGTAPLSYQWRKGTTNITTGTSAELTLNDVRFTDAGSFEVIVTNSAGSVISAAATLVVNPVGAPTIVTQPQPQTIRIGANVTFTVAAEGTPSLTYQWRRGTTLIPGATSTTLSLTNVQANEAGGYEVVVSNSLGSVTSRAAVLAVNALVAWGFNHAGQTTVPAGLGALMAIAAGGDHNVVLKAAGTVAAWGENTGGSTTIPLGLNGVTAVATGTAHTVALKDDGTVVAWGAEGFAYGQTTIPAGLNGVTAISAGAFHTIALRVNGTVVAWGRNADGQATIPAGLSGVTAIAAGYAHTVALKEDGTVVAWGWNAMGQRNVPIGLSGVTAIAAGAYHTVALKSDGTVVGWGQTVVPVGLSGVTAIAAGDEHVVALKSDGTVIAWGGNSQGQATVPAGLSGVKAIAAGGYHTLAHIGPLKTNPPTIASHPLSQTVNAGQSVTFSVSASGLSPFSYQWRKGGVNLLGGTAATLTLVNVPLSAGGSYDVVVGNSGGSVLSNVATLSVTPVFTTPPSSQIVSAGGSITFVAAPLSSTPPPALRWQHSLDQGTTWTDLADGGAVSGATTNALTVSGATSTLSGRQYRLKATYTSGTIFSSAATLTITAEPAPTIEPLAPAERWRKAEFRLAGIPPVANPFDPEVIRVDATFTSPTGATHVVPAFWYEPFTRSLPGSHETITSAGPGGWRLRFTPAEAGAYGLSLHIQLNGQPWQTVTQSMAVTAAALPARFGFVRNDAHNRRFETADGQPLRLNGANVGWYGARGTFDYDDWFPSMQAAQENFARVWMADWCFSIEGHVGTLTRYDLARAWQLDYTVELAEQRGIYLLLCLEMDSIFSTEVWHRHPYNAVNGGPVTSGNPNGYFTQADARKLFQKRLRYLIGRYGYSQNLLAWEFFNEIDNLYSVLNRTDVVAWHAVMSEWLHAHDPYRHLVTTSLKGGSDDADLWTLPHLDFTCYHSYGETAHARRFAAVAQDFVTRYNKPVLIGEFGVSGAGWRRTDEDPHLRGFRQALWGGAVGGSVGTAMSWWWENLHADNVYPYFKSLASILNRASAANTTWTAVKTIADNQAPFTVGDAITGGQPFNAQLALNTTWQAVLDGKFALTSPETAAQSNTALNGFVHGNWMPAPYRLPFIVNARFAEGAKVVIRVKEASVQATLTVKVDGTEVYRLALENRVYNQDFAVALPAGVHTIELYNPNNGWVYFDWVRFEAVLPSRYAGNWEPPAEVIGVRGSSDSVLYITAPGHAFPSYATQPSVPAIQGKRIELADWPAGTYAAAWYRPADGTLVARGSSTTVAGSLILALPDFSEDLAGIVFKPSGPHSADTNGDLRISLIELTRVIELFNVRNGTNRTGAYRANSTGEDGFAPDATRTSSATGTLLAKYHTADSDRDGRLGLFELTRVIELYNYRNGTVRTGQYHVSPATEDAYTPGP